MSCGNDDVRKFNTEGPVRADRHYHIPPLTWIDLDDVLGLIRDQHRPHRRSCPARASDGRGHGAFIEFAGDRTDAQVFTGVVAVDVANHRGLRLDDFVEGIMSGVFLW